MNTSDTDLQASGSDWLPAMAAVVLAVLAVAVLLNGAGHAGIVVAASEGVGRSFTAPRLSADEQVPFGKVDRALGRLDISEDGQMAEDEMLEPVLEALVEAISAGKRAHGEESEALGRVRFLLEKSLPPAVADQFVALLPDYLSYRRAEQAMIWFRGWRSPGSIEEAYVQHLVQHQLRRVALGESATQRLFQATFRLTDMHFSRQMLMRRNDLDEDEKRHLMDAQVEALAPPGRPEDAG